MKRWTLKHWVVLGVLVALVGVLTPTYLTELPDWAKEGNPVWLVYPDGFECVGTEGCPTTTAR